MGTRTRSIEPLTSAKPATTPIVVDEATVSAETVRVERESKEQLASNALRRGETIRKELLKTYRAEEKVPMYLSPMYRPYFGNVMTIMINGIHITFRVDGTIQEVPKTFADEIVFRRQRIDALLVKQQRMADVSANLESSPGELQLF